MKASQIEAYRERLIETYLIEAIDRELPIGSIGTYLDERILTGTGYRFTNEIVEGLLVQFGFSSYKAWQESQH